MQPWPHSRVLLECLFLLLPPFLCVAWGCAVVNKKDHTAGAIHQKKIMTTIFFSPMSFIAVFGSGIRDPGFEIRDPGSGMGKNQDPGSGINIPDPPHW